MTRVLVAEHAAYLNSSINEILLSGNFEVVGEASNGIEAVQLYKQHNPDVVTIDITMPGMDGIAAIKKIIAFDPKASIVVFSSLAQKDLVLEAIRAGAKDFIIKPFHRNRFISSIKDVLSS